MVENKKSSKIKKGINKFFDLLSKAIFFILIIILGIGMFSGGLNLLNYEFIKYLITLSFVLAGFTFYAIFNRRSDGDYYWIIQSCWSFILAGFFFLASITILNINETSNKLLLFLKTYIPIAPILGLVFFIVGMVILVCVLNKIVNTLKVKTKKKA